MTKCFLRTSMTPALAIWQNPWQKILLIPLHIQL